MNNNNNRGSELKNKIASKAVSSVGGPLAGKAVEKLGKKNGNRDLISKMSSKKANNESLDEAQTANDELQDQVGQSKNNEGSVRNKLSSLMPKKVDKLSPGGNSLTNLVGNGLLKNTGFFSSIKFKIILGLSGFILLLIFIITIYAAVASVGGAVTEFFTGIGDFIVGFIEENDEKQMNKYYDKLKKTKEKQYKNKGVCIDENLITATLTVDLDALDFKKQRDSELNPLGEDKAEYSDEVLEQDRPSLYYGDPEDANESADEVFDNEDHVFLDALLALTGSSPIDSDLAELAFDTEEEKEDYKKMRKEIQLLSNMQIKTKRYGYDYDLRGIAIRDCRPIDDPEEEEKFLVTEENVDRFDPKGLNVPAYLNVNGGFISDSPELVAKHDKKAFAAFFTKKSKEETNYEFYIYSPKDHEECSDENGDGQEECKIVCNKKLPKNEYELSIGDLSNMEESVYYWNLVNSFIPNYYDEYLPESGPERDEAIKYIAEEIYLLYEDLGPGQSCAVFDPHETICRTDGGPYFDTEPGPNGEANIDVQKLIDLVAPVAIEEMSRTGYNASVTIAQAIIESGVERKKGLSMLSTEYGNYFGATAGRCAPSTDPSTAKYTMLESGEGGNNCTGNAFWDGTIVAMCNDSGGDCQWYRVYDNLSLSVRDHNQILLNPKYYSGCNNSRDTKAQLDCIGVHYATAGGYADTVMGKVKKYNLTQYDIGEWDGEYVEITEPQYTSNICYNLGGFYGGGYGDWANWLQGDSRWSGLYIDTKTIGEVGCALTSVAVQIARSGVSTTIGPNFNPGTFMQAHKANGGFTNCCDKNGCSVTKNCISWNVSDVAPNFQYEDYVSFSSISQLKSLVDQGYYLVLSVKNGGHWVAIDKVVGDTVYIYDSALRGGVRYTTANQYGVNTFGRIIKYKKVGN